MKLIRDYIEFRNRTKPVCDDFYLDIAPDIGLGFFFPSRLNELEQYCANRPQYHIMSMLPSAIKVNKPIPGARFYQLAEGDADPDLWYLDSACQEVYNYSETRKFDRS
jgi:hypothetical protein